ncbi:MAG: hemerythrin family protein [Halieaceae bacterium]|jgi:hemerythrin-like metal-binding protein|nr:hemerythrin family protein [Halieaceae bacterium]
METLRKASSGNSFIDENHEKLLLTLDSLTEVVRDRYDERVFQQTFSNFLTELENHFSHEEALLKGTDFDELEIHILKHRDIALGLRMQNVESRTYEGAVSLLAKTRSTVFNHELLEDQKYWSAFERKYGTDSQLPAEYRTGLPEIDGHHEALLNFIQRISGKAQTSDSRSAVCRELKDLRQHAQEHFAVEEERLKSRGKSQHIDTHKSLLHDLDILITEVGDGIYELANLEDYLRFWLLAHVKHYDVPAFALSP